MTPSQTAKRNTLQSLIAAGLLSLVLTGAALAQSNLSKTVSVASNPCPSNAALASYRKAVPHIRGIWMRSGDQLKFRLRQNGATIQAEFSSLSVHHVMTGSWNAEEDQFDYTVIRTSAAGVTEMYGHLYVLDANTIKTVIVGTDGRSDLPLDFHEVSYWKRQ